MGRKKLKSNKGNCHNGCNRKIHCRGVCRRCYRKLHYEEHERERRGATKHILLEQFKMTQVVIKELR